MGEFKNEFTNLTSLRAEAMGEPGERTFRILVGSGGSSAVMWLEKEQLFQLALAIQQLLTTVREGEVSPGTPSSDLETSTQLDFKVSKLAMGYDSTKGMFVIDAHEDEEENEDAATVRAWANRAQVKEFASEALTVCAAGRPLCPLCGGPIDADAHRCPRVNGHVKAGNI